MNESAYLFFEDLGRRICDVTGDTREVSFIFQWLAVTIQRFNAALYRCFCVFFVLTSWIYTTMSTKITLRQIPLD